MKMIDATTVLEKIKKAEEAKKAVMEDLDYFNVRYGIYTLNAFEVNCDDSAAANKSATQIMQDERTYTNYLNAKYWDNLYSFHCHKVQE